jgi:hypothetical protein
MALGDAVFVLLTVNLIIGIAAWCAEAAQPRCVRCWSSRQPPACDPATNSGSGSVGSPYARHNCSPSASETDAVEHIQIDGLHIQEELILVGAVGIDAAGPLSAAVESVAPASKSSCRRRRRASELAIMACPAPGSRRLAIIGIIAM